MYMISRISPMGKQHPMGSIHRAQYRVCECRGDHDTASFAVESIRRWWENIGKGLYAEKTELLITSDGGGSNGVRNKLWKKELQGLANETGLSITVNHLPPATSKWNKIEHRLFSYIFNQLERKATHLS